MLGYGSAMVREAPETSPDSSGGPIRRTVGITTRSGYGMRPYGWPTMVRRTPHQVVPDAEAGGARYPGLQYMKFLPDGRLVAGDALGGAFGADPDPQQLFQQAVARAQQALDVARTWGLVGAAGFGVLVGGFLLGGSGHRLRTGVLSAAAFGGGVALTRYIVQQAAASPGSDFVTTPSMSTTRSGPGHF